MALLLSPETASMNGRSDVSVIIVNYNSTELLGQCLRSVHDRTHLRGDRARSAVVGCGAFLAWAANVRDEKARGGVPGCPTVVARWRVQRFPAPSARARVETAIGVSRGMTTHRSETPPSGPRANAVRARAAMRDFRACSSPAPRHPLQQLPSVPGLP